MDLQERNAVLKELRLLAMAKDIKYVLKQKGFKNGKVQMGARYFFVEPFDISKPVVRENLKRIREAKIKKQERFARVGFVEFEHPFAKGAYKFEGPVVKICLEKVLEELGNAKVGELIKTGAVFSVRKKNVPENLEKRTAVVQVSVYQPIKNDELKEIRNQNVLMDNKSYSPKVIKEKIVEFKSKEKSK